jgi:hypothetical protein
MDERRAPKVVLIFGLIVSMVVNAVTLLDNRELRLSKEEVEESYTDLENSFDELKASLDELNNAYCELNRTYWELGIKYSDLEGSYLALFDDPFSPPVSKLQAILIALKHGGWNSSNLRGMAVTASLKYIYFRVAEKEYEAGILHEVMEPVSDYSPVVEGDVTYRYAWFVNVEKAGPRWSMPWPELYVVDAATGEIVTWGRW